MWGAVRGCIVAGVAAAVLAACADGPPPGGPSDTRRFGGSDAPGEGFGHGARAELNVFISPSGEPFRGRAGDAYASAAWFAGADSDHDGRLSRAEFLADALRAFASYDTDHDGTIDAFEIQHYEQAIAPEILPRIEGLRGGEGMDDTLFKRGAGRRSRGDAQRPQAPSRGRQFAADRRAEGGGLYGMLAEPEPLTAADADLGGTVTRAEWIARSYRRFDLLDAAGSGYLKLDSLPKTEAQLLLERRRAREAAAARRPPPR